MQNEQCITVHRRSFISKVKMKFIILAALFACAMAMPKRMVIPRLPVAVLESGRYQLIPEDRIVGGAVVEPNSLPFQVSLQRGSVVGGYSQSCGGSILDENVIIDASHCVDGANAANLRVVAGEHDLSTASGLEQYRDVASYKMHESYNTKTVENDIALIFLASPLDLSVPSAQPVKLPDANQEYEAGTIVTVSGWGTTSSGGSISDLLRSVDVPVVSDAVCDAAYGGTTAKPQVFPSMLCAGDISGGGIDSCQGDSGGPLFTKADAVQHGIVSWGRGCALAGYPGVYTQVSYFLDWIAANRK